MLRVILLALSVVALVWLVRRAFGPTANRRKTGRAENDGVRVDELVRCAHCGVHLPRVDAQTRDGRHFCSREHARLGEREDVK